MLTVYGSKAVLETLRDNTLSCHALHIASSNRQAGIVKEILALAGERELEVKEHSREALARISRNGRQDQGVALDVICPQFASVEDFIAQRDGSTARLIALDGITNPQNLGMIIRSAAAGDLHGLVLPRRGNAALGPLVIKASAGTIYRAPLLLCEDLPAALATLRDAAFSIYHLDANADQSLFESAGDRDTVYVLGNETTGVSEAARAMSDGALHIPMRNGVESLNVAVSASLIAYAHYFDR